jgi:hypothetical protein
MMALMIVPALLIGWLVFAHDHAPEGWQDGEGFHYGRLSGRPGRLARAEAPTVPVGTRKLKEAPAVERTLQ